MDIISAFREVGTYRGAAELCGTTHKTVKRVVDRAEAGGERPEPSPRPRNYEQVRELVANVVVPTAEYVRFATHYGFSPDWCHANDPQSKGIVENLCGYAQRDLAVPLLTEAAMTGRVVSLREANTAAKTWCAEVNSL